MEAFSTLYLAYDGVLHPNVVSFHGQRQPRLRAGGHTFFENNDLLREVIAACPNTVVVLHCWWVPYLGFQAAIHMLPQAVRSHVIGATWHSNRGPRARRRQTGCRRDWLEEDLMRRRPERPVLLDCDVAQMAPMLSDCSCIVDGWKGLTSGGACERLLELLATDATDASLTLGAPCLEM